MEELLSIRRAAVNRRLQFLTKQMFWARQMAITAPPGEVSRYHWGTVQATNDLLCDMLLEVGYLEINY